MEDDDGTGSLVGLQAPPPPRLRQLLFKLFEPHYGTIGDKKPLLLLALYTASSRCPCQDRIVPPVLVELSFEEEFMKFAYRLVEHLFAGHRITKTRHRIVVENRLVMFHFGTVAYHVPDLLLFQAGDFNRSPWEPIRSNTVECSFGDNPGPNRFVSTFLGYKRGYAQNAMLAPMVLPLAGPRWSFNEHAMTRVEAFCRYHKHHGHMVVAIAGSLTPPCGLEAVLEWLEDHAEPQPFAFLLLGYQERILASSSSPVMAAPYVEYEDVVRVVDFIITNCGAGSVTVPLVYGVPQTCALYSRRPVGNDKPSNAKDIRELQVGPAPEAYETQLEDILADLANKRKFEMYTKNARAAKAGYEDDLDKTRQLMGTILCSPEGQAPLIDDMARGVSHRLGGYQFVVD